jgi:hypothetical protein
MSVDDLVLAFYNGVPWEKLTPEQQERFANYLKERSTSEMEKDDMSRQPWATRTEFATIFALGVALGIVLTMIVTVTR